VAQGAWDSFFPGSVDWDLGWRLHLAALQGPDSGRVVPPRAQQVPGAFATTGAREVRFQGRCAQARLSTAAGSGQGG
jgi:hypothetical protein